VNCIGSGDGAVVNFGDGVWSGEDAGATNSARAAKRNRNGRRMGAVKSWAGRHR